MPTTRRIKRRKATRGGSRSVQKQRIKNARHAAAGRTLGNWAEAATAATTGERHRRILALLAQLREYVSPDTHTSILNIAEQVSPAQRVLVLGAAERTAKKHIRSDINQHVVNVAAVAAAENEVNALKEEAKRMADNA